MTTEKDSRLVDYLYDELSEEEANAFERTLESDDALSSELAGFEETLETLRTVEAEDPSPHLDSLILAHAREAAGELEAEESKRGLRGWVRKMFASPVAGLIAAGSVAMIAAIVTVPTMMLSESEEAPVVQQIPAPVSAPVDEPADVPLERQPAQRAEPEVSAEVEEEPAPLETRRLDPPPDRKRKAKKSARPAKPAVAAKPAPKREAKVQRSFGYQQAKDVELDSSSGRASRARPSGPPAPATPPTPPAPTPQAGLRKADRPARVATAEATRDEAADAPANDEAANDEAALEERGRSMLAAASAEFKRGNPEGGRRILVRALSIVRRAPVHAEIAFRLAQHDFERGAYKEAVSFARIAASAPRFARRKAALDLVIESEKMLRAQQKRAAERNLAPASPPAGADADAEGR